MNMKCHLSHGLGRRLPIAALVLISGVLVSLPAGAGLWGPAPNPQTPKQWLQNCLIYALEGVYLPGAIPGQFDISAGPNVAGTFRSDVCSVGSVEVGRDARVPVEAPALTDVAVIADTIQVTAGGKTSECLYQTSLSGSCPQTRNESLATMPQTQADIDPWVPFPIITPGATDITLATGETRTLAPGQYGRVLLNLNSRLVFSTPGNYQFRSIETRTKQIRSYIDVTAQKVNIMVKEYMLLGHRTQVNAADTRLLKVFVEGTDGWTWNGDPGWPAFAFRGDGIFNACYVYSPNGEQWWRGKPLEYGAYKTQSFTKNFRHDVSSSVFRVKMEHPQDEECFDVEITCGSIGRAYLPGSPGMICDPVTGQVEIKGWALSKKTLTELMFFPEGTSIPVGADVPTMRALSCLEVPKDKLDYLPDETTIENSIRTQDNVLASLAANCGPPVKLVPVLMGPLVTPNSPVCYSGYTAERLEVIDPTNCQVVPAP